jgi:hypothetical protein
VKAELAELLAEMRASLPHLGFDAALTATALARIDQLEDLLARKDAARDDIAWHAFNLGGLWGQPMADKYFERLNGEEKRGRDLGAARRKSKEVLFAAIDELRTAVPRLTIAEATRALMPEFGTTAEDRKADDYGRLRERTIRAYVAERWNA